MNPNFAKVDEKLEFKVIEFSKESKRIVLAHTRLVEDRQHSSKANDNVKMNSETQENIKIVERMKGMDMVAIASVLPWLRP